MENCQEKTTGIEAAYLMQARQGYDEDDTKNDQLKVNPHFNHRPKTPLSRRFLVNNWYVYTANLYAAEN